MKYKHQVDSNMKSCPVCESTDIKFSNYGFFIKCNCCNFELDGCPKCGWRGVTYIPGTNIVEDCYNEGCNYSYNESPINVFKNNRGYYDLGDFSKCKFTKTGAITQASAPDGWYESPLKDRLYFTINTKVRSSYKSDEEWLEDALFEDKIAKLTVEQLREYHDDPSSIPDWIKYTGHERWQLKAGQTTRDILEAKSGKPRYDLTEHEKWQLANGHKTAYELDRTANDQAWIRYSEHERWEISVGQRDGYTGKRIH